jgi:hypothetical protein
MCVEITLNVEQVTWKSQRCLLTTWVTLLTAFHFIALFQAGRPQVSHQGRQLKWVPVAVLPLFL